MPKMTKTRAYNHVKYLRQLTRDLEYAINHGEDEMVDETALEIYGTVNLLQEAFGVEDVL